MISQGLHDSSPLTRNGKKRKRKKKVSNYFFNVSASLEDSIIYDDIKLFLIMIYLTVTFIKMSSVTC